MQARTGWPATEEITEITTSNAIAPAKVTAEWLAKKELNQQQGQQQYCRQQHCTSKSSDTSNSRYVGNRRAPDTAWRQRELRYQQ